MRRLLYPLLALLLCFPALQAGGVVGRAEGELRDHLWVAWMVQHRLQAGALPLFFPEANVPAGLSLYPLDPLNHLALFLLSPLGLLPAVLLWTLLLLSLIGLAADRLAGVLGASVFGRTLAGILCMVGPPVLGPYVDTQTEGMGIGWMLLLMADLLEPGNWSRGRALRVAAWGCLLAASAPYQAHGIVVIAGGLALMLGGRIALWGLLPAGATALLLGWAMVAAEGKGQLGARQRVGDWPPSIIVGVEVAPRSEPISVNFLKEANSYAHTPLRAPPTTGPRAWSGWCLPLFAILALFQSKKEQQRARLLWGIAFFYALLSIGSAKPTFLNADGRNWIPLPFDLWYRYYPLGRLAWKPAQYAIPAWIFMCAASVALLLPDGGPRRRQLLGGVLALGILLELQIWGPTPGPLPAVTLQATPWMSALAAESGGAVLEFPSRARAREGVDRMPADVLLGPLFHGRAVGESFGRSGNRVQAQALESLALALGWHGTAAPPLPEALKAAAKAGFSDLIVHRRYLTGDERNRLDTVLATQTLREQFPDGVAWYALK